MTARTVTMLVVDDDQVDLMAIQRAFKQLRIANPMVVAHNGLEALEHLRGQNGRTRIQRPFMVLLDLNMPRMGGIEFLAELRRDAELADAIVFVLTTSKAEEDLVAAYGHNVAGYVVKGNVGADFMRLLSLLDAYWRIVELP